MKPLSRRQAIQLASSYLATAPLLSGASRAQTAPGTGAIVFDMANFWGPGVDADAAFAKALAAISKAAGDAAKAGGPVHIVFNLGKNATYRINRPLAFKELHGFELNGNGAQLINTARGSTLTISSSSHVTIRDLTIDYDPLPFTQGTIAAFDKAALQITVKVDAGYPDDPAFLATITDGFFKVMDRQTKALKAGRAGFPQPRQGRADLAGADQGSLALGRERLLPKPAAGRDRRYGHDRQRQRPCDRRRRQRRDKLH